MTERGDLSPRQLLGFGGGLRRVAARPQRVRGAIPWDDARWWAMRRYRPVLCEGDIPLPPWILTLPAECGVRRVSAGVLELTDGGLTVTVTAQRDGVSDRRERTGEDRPAEVAGAEATGGEPGGDATRRWQRSGITGTSRTWSDKGHRRFDHVLVAESALSGDEGNRLLTISAKSANPHDRHWVSALVQGVRLAEP